MEEAVAAAKAAFPAWRDTSVSVRARVMFKLQSLIREHTDDLADVITLELGKVTADAKGDVFRGLEIVGKILCQCLLPWRSLSCELPLNVAPLENLYRLQRHNVQTFQRYHVP